MKKKKNRACSTARHYGALQYTMSAMCAQQPTVRLPLAHSHAWCVTPESPKLLGFYLIKHLYDSQEMCRDFTSNLSTLGSSFTY